MPSTYSKPAATENYVTYVAVKVRLQYPLARHAHAALRPGR